MNEVLNLCSSVTAVGTFSTTARSISRWMEKCGRVIIKQMEDWREKMKGGKRKIYFVRHASLISVHSVEEREGGEHHTEIQVGERERGIE